MRFWSGKRKKTDRNLKQQKKMNKRKDGQKRGKKGINEEKGWFKSREYIDIHFPKWGKEWEDDPDWNIFKFASVAQLIKNLSVMQETQIWSPSLEDSLEKEMATHPSILAWRIPWTEKSSSLQSTGSQKVRHDRANNFSFSFSNILHTTSSHLCSFQ